MPFGYTYLHLERRKSLILLVSTFSLPALFGITILKLLVSTAQPVLVPLISAGDHENLCRLFVRLSFWVLCTFTWHWALRMRKCKSKGLSHVYLVGFLGVLHKSFIACVARGDRSLKGCSRWAWGWRRWPLKHDIYCPFLKRWQLLNQSDEQGEWPILFKHFHLVLVRNTNRAFWGLPGSIWST